MNLRPLGDRVLVKRVAEEEKTSGGIIIPGNAQEKPVQGTVIAVGNGRLENNVRIPIDVKVGDTVVFGKYAGTEVRLGDQQFLILNESDILAVAE